MCPDREILSAYVDGEVHPPWDASLAEHLTSCGSCQAALESLTASRQALRDAADVEWQEPMDRVRRRLSDTRSRVPRWQPVWRRQIALPVPVAAVAAALLLTLGVAVAVLAVRANVGYVRVTRAPSGTEFQFAVPYDKVESLLKAVGGSDSAVESVMTLPSNVKLIPVGEPRMVKAADAARKK